MNWDYEKSPPNGGAPGDAYRSVFNGSGKNAAESLAREAIQNSVDAASEPGEAVRVDFRFRRLRDDQREDFEEAASLEDIRERVHKLGLPEKHALMGGGEEPSKLDLLYIDDYKTTGLVGNPQHPQSNLRKLLMDLGGSVKTRDKSGSGGSYGFGKAVYSSNSRIGAIFAFSRTVDPNDKPLSILMGCAYHSEHRFRNGNYSGRAFFGVAKNVTNGIRYDPLRGSKAERLAERLGFEREDGLGTSLLLIDSKVKAEELVAGIEDWWWPRIESRLLEATVFERNGEERVPRPMARVHLQPFITAFDNALGKSPDIPNRQQRNTINIRGWEVGKLGALVLDDNQDEYPLGEEFEDRLDTVALVRGPHMVVAYHKNWRPGSTDPLAVGCFIADDDVNEELRLSEPPAHDRWDPEADRLDDTEGKEVVKGILSRIKNAFREFQKSAKPPAPPPSTRLTQLERELASWFGTGAQGPKSSPVPNPAPISLRIDGPKIKMDGDRLRATGLVEVELKPDREETEVPFKIRLSLKVVEEDSVLSTDQIQLTLTPLCPLDQLNDGFWAGVVTPDSTARIKFTSEPYDPGWTVEFMPEVHPVEETMP